MNFLFLRGLSREVRHWEGLPKAIAAGRKTKSEGISLALDLRGAGESYMEKSPLSINEYTDDLRERAASLISSSSPCILVGMSLGGMVALHWVQKNPKDFAGVVLINSSFANVSPLYARLSLSSSLAIFKMAAQQNAFKRELAVIKLTSNLLSEANQNALAFKWASYYRDRPFRKENLLRQLVAASRSHAKKRIQIPTLILNSKGDRLVSPRCSEDLKRHLEGEKIFLKTHDNAGHDIALDDPKWLKSKLLSFSQKALSA